MDRDACSRPPRGAEPSGDIRATEPQGPALVTIAIPTFNRAARLRQALQSAQEQTYPNLEIIVGDNASTDDTPEICAGAVASDPRVRVDRSPVNVGAVPNFHRLVDLARGDYFLWLADDDRVAPDYVAVCLAELRARPSAVLVAGQARFVDDDGNVRRYEEPVEIAAPSEARRVIRFFWTVFENSVFYGLAPTDVLRRALGRSTLLAHDWKLVASLAACGTVHTVRSTHIARAMGGSSSSMAGLVRAYDANVLVRAAPYTSIAVAMARHVFSHHSFQTLPVLRRAPLAAASFGIIIIRFWPRQWYRQLWLRWRQPHDTQIWT